MFSVTVGVYDSSGKIIENTNANYMISIALTPSGTIHGTVSGTTVSGQITFTNLRILSAGSFSIVASSTNINSFTSTPAIPITNFLTAIALSSSPSLISANTLATITATLTAEDTHLFTGSTQVVLSQTNGNDIVGTLTLSTTSGTATFSVYFTIPGVKSLTASAFSITSSISLTILQQKIIITSLTPTVLFI